MKSTKANLTSDSVVRDLPPARPESYWQIGFNDGYADAPRQFTPPDGPNETNADLQASGYCNGYDAGHTKRFSERQPEMMRRFMARTGAAE